MRGADTYEQLVRDFCHTAGIADWRELADTKHIALGQRLVGLVPFQRDDLPMVSVCIELGQTYPERDGGIYETMLLANLDAGVASRGHYALHPDSRQAIYCMCFALGEMTGEQLAHILDEELRSCGVEGLADFA